MKYSGKSRQIYYLEKGILTFIKPFCVAGVLDTTSSVLLVGATFVKVNSIIIKTGTRSNRKGEVFAKVFICLLLSF
jgi:hypothetical protein